MKCLNSEPIFIVSLLSIISSISSQSESVNRTNMLLPNQPAPDFEGTAVIGTEFHPITLRQFRGSYVLLVFYPLDFTFVCPTELIAFSERAAEFKSRGCQVIACSTDSIYSHLAWTKLDRKAGGLGQMNIPLLSDKNLKISRAYGVLDEEEGHAFRGMFLIDPNGVLRQITVNDRPVGRSVDEAIRLLDAFIFFEKNGEVCPANWKPKSATIKPDPTAALSYFSSVN
uniref:Thioredoxin peroxidase n=1 Tax=Schistosoma japonicum TaxID=6182 RepID=C1LMD2_SCHJA|nr:Thioredoxin peroxidase [Schistosoma japonicum]